LNIHFFVDLCVSVTQVIVHSSNIDTLKVDRYWQLCFSSAALLNQTFWDVGTVFKQAQFLCFVLAVLGFELRASHLPAGVLPLEPLHQWSCVWDCPVW
jgi:hypothetical protein